MPATALLRAGLLLYLAAGTRQLSISEFDVPEAVVVGEDAQLVCKYKLGVNETEDALYVKWWWKPAAPPGDKTLVYQHIAGHPAEPAHHDNSFQIEIKDGDTIVLKNLKPQDSGIFECEVSNIDEVRNHDELTVYTKGSGPELNISTILDGPDDGDVADLLIKCEAENVAPAPSLVLKYNGQEIKEIVEVLSENDGLYRIFANATLSKERVEAGDVQCEMLFPLNNFTHPAYIAVQQYDPAGEPATTTELAGEAAPAATPGSLQNTSDGGHRLHSSWALLLAAAVFTNFIFVK